MPFLSTEAENCNIGDNYIPLLILFVFKLCIPNLIIWFGLKCGTRWHYKFSRVLYKINITQYWPAYYCRTQTQLFFAPLSLWQKQYFYASRLYYTVALVTGLIKLFPEVCVENLTQQNKISRKLFLNNKSFGRTWLCFVHFLFWLVICITLPCFWKNVSAR